MMVFRIIKVFRIIICLFEMVQSIVQINSRSQPILIISFSVNFNDTDADKTWEMIFHSVPL